MSASLSGKRLLHVLAVEKMADRLARLYFENEDDLALISAAALLHDNTKELSFEEHLELIKHYGADVLPEDIESPPTLHAITGALVIPDRYPEFSDDRVIGAVKYHTTGRSGMNLYEKIVFLADYIDETRAYPDCVAVRSLFWDADLQSMSLNERIRHLDLAIISAIDRTLSHLEKEGRTIHPATRAARDALARGGVI